MTKREVSALPVEVNTYETVGRMFVRRPKEHVMEVLDTRVKRCEEKVASLEQNKKYLETSVKERENNLRELVAQKIAKKPDNK